MSKNIQQSDRLTSAPARDGKRNPRVKSRDIARRQARAAKRAVQGR